MHPLERGALRGFDAFAVRHGIGLTEASVSAVLDMQSHDELIAVLAAECCHLRYPHLAELEKFIPRITVMCSSGSLRELVARMALFLVMVAQDAGRAAKVVQLLADAVEISEARRYTKGDDMHAQLLVACAEVQALLGNLSNCLAIYVGSFEKFFLPYFLTFQSTRGYQF